MGSSNLHTRASSVTPPALPTVRVHRRHSHDRETVDTDTPLPPVVLSGEYEFVKQLGRGGMGVVYLARQRGLKRNVAYKVLTQFGSLDPETLGRFRGEAETLAKLHHPSIVQVYDAGSANGSPYLAMEYVAGGSLAERVRSGRQDPRAAAAVIATVAGAVGHAHAHGIIHRDLKPANILLTADGRPKVADFGLARDLASAGVTRTGYIAGTPAYMAPEQLTGNRDLGPAVDIWALGAMLYELLAGTVPFAGDDPPQILANILRHEPVSLRRWQPHLPRDLETICMKCLQKEPGRRYATGTELADDLLRFLDGQTILARPIGRIEKSIRWSRRNPLASGLLATTAVVLVSATAMSLALATRADEQRAIAEAHAERANRAREAEARLREEAERSAAAEKKAREDAVRMTALLDGLLAGIRSGPNPLNDLLKQMEGAARNLELMQGDPLIRARILLTLGITRRNLGRFEEAVPLVERAFELRVRNLGLKDPLTRATAVDLGYTYYHVNRNDDAIRVLLPAIEVETAESGPESDTVVDQLGLLRMFYASAGRIEDEAKLGDRLLAINVRRYGPDHENTEWMRVNLHRYQVATGNFQESIPVLRKAFARFLDCYGPNGVCTQWTRVTLGLSLLRSGRPREALPYLHQNYVAALNDNSLQHEHSRYATTFLAECYESMDRAYEAVPLRRLLLKYYLDAGDTVRAAKQQKLLDADLAAAQP